ncbi:hypothetical protein [Nostoc sp. UHCC 0252]|uniref:hypothetical protein n=1 Tax=Nostoc sp. UHCC 0252 TaxID=3110241 RepID=UPI002B20865C|nr:hypothetical protein [Nostoc sp. UHCC 0252]MEA5604514.1 hypothetical protein [Nostoc sp. UHCC 0252]
MYKCIWEFYQIIPYLLSTRSRIKLFCAIADFSIPEVALHVNTIYTKMLICSIHNATLSGFIFAAKD